MEIHKTKHTFLQMMLISRLAINFIKATQSYFHLFVQEQAEELLLLTAVRPASIRKVEVKTAATAIVNTVHHGNLPPVSSVSHLQIKAIQLQ